MQTSPNPLPLVGRRAGAQEVGEHTESGPATYRDSEQNLSSRALRVSTLDDATRPRFLKIEEAAGALGIGRSTAYELAHMFLATEGREGLPVIKLGRSLRVPASALERWAGIGNGES